MDKEIIKQLDTPKFWHGVMLFSLLGSCGVIYLAYWVSPEEFHPASIIVMILLFSNAVVALLKYIDTSFTTKRKRKNDDPL